MFSISYLLRNVFQILIIDIIYIYHLLHKSREIMTYFETHFVLCANCWPTTPTFDPPSNSISSIVKCGKNSIGINAFLEKAYGCSLCRGFGRKMYREKYGLFVDDDDSLFWKEAYYCNFFPALPPSKFYDKFLFIDCIILPSWVSQKLWWIILNFSFVLPNHAPRFLKLATCFWKRRYKG